ncbi:sialate O-acetylesterase [Rubellicoccus peritrichatus]|uniref:Sialate O-acetylesterase n=1 Tax=Rubellicoccus peritrichatus TaxID=3080537 RepID=A0AAQ3LBT1_9BACT|nr:sialate O-acetylesterase [Puniceicoccus sp. CR14]WOO41482.1 sialate O-acetylesterase [Puniceicoccus sp. CR14]
MKRILDPVGCWGLLALFMILAMPAATLSANAAAELRLAAVISDGMVLQQGLPVRLWGSGSPGASIMLKLGPEKATATVGQDGKWQCELPALRDGGPIALEIASGNERLSVGDILVGEVWLCSGQSNMHWPLKKSANAKSVIAAADNTEIRFFTVAQNASVEGEPSLEGKWEVCQPDSAAEFSAIAYYFGKQLHESLDVPVGLIGSSWGGTAAAPWTAPEAFEGHPQLGYLAKTRSGNLRKASKQIAAGQEPKGTQRIPGVLYDNMIRPLVFFGLRGVIWYQGESNVKQASQYAVLFPTLIESWRSAWGRQDLPFLFVQLPNYREKQSGPKGSQWAELRESQFKTLELPNTGMAVTIDIGEANDLHPKNKKDVGERLARIALHDVYGIDVKGPATGPLFSACDIKGNEVVVSFDYAEGGLKTIDGMAPKAFAVAGQDGQFVSADARIENNTVIVSSSEITSPVAVRYAWEGNPEVNLVNQANLPASPFRSSS